MELGALEVAVLREVRRLGRTTPGDLHQALSKESKVAYTSITTTLYRLVEKGLLKAEKQSEKRIYYSVNEGSPQYRRLARALADRYWRAFGGASLGYFLEAAEDLDPEDLQRLEERVREIRRRER